MVFCQQSQTVQETMVRKTIISENGEKNITARLWCGRKQPQNNMSEGTASDLFIGLDYLFVTRNHGRRESLK